MKRKVRRCVLGFPKTLISFSAEKAITQDFSISRLLFSCSHVSMSDNLKWHASSFHSKELYGSLRVHSEEQKKNEKSGTRTNQTKETVERWAERRNKTESFVAGAVFISIFTPHLSAWLVNLTTLIYNIINVNYIQFYIGAWPALLRRFFSGKGWSLLLFTLTLCHQSGIASFREPSSR